MNITTEIDRQIAEPWRKPDGKFGPGNPGKPKGARGRAGKAEIDRLRARSEKVWAVIDQRLAENCVKTALFLASRMLPDVRSIELDSVQPEDVAEAIAAGEITVSEAAKLANAVKTLKDAAAVDEMRARLDEIEALLAAKGRG
jgi:hypothetical protein